MCIGAFFLISAVPSNIVFAEPCLRKAFYNALSRGGGSGKERVCKLSDSTLDVSPGMLEDTILDGRLNALSARKESSAGGGYGASI